MAERDRDQSPSAGPQYSRDLTNRCFITRIGRRVTIMSEADMFDHRDSHDHVETSLGEGQSHRTPAHSQKVRMPEWIGVEIHPDDLKPARGHCNGGPPIQQTTT